MRTLAIVIAMLAATTPANAAEIDAFISTALKTVTDEVIPAVRAARGQPQRSRALRAARRFAQAFRSRRARGYFPHRPRGDRPVDRRRQDRVGPRRSCHHRHRHLRAQGRAEAGRVDAGRIQARHARGENRGLCLARRWQHRRPAYSENICEARHRRADGAEIKTLRRRPNAPRSASWCRAAKPRSACSR